MKYWIITAAVVLAALLTYANWPIEPLPAGTRITRIEIQKSTRTLTIYTGPSAIRRYNIALGTNPVGPKDREGDKRTPEGTYSVTELKGDSAFHKALRISYPTPEQTKAAESKGLKPGGDIMIHGLRNGVGLLGRFHSNLDWTAGCVALTNSEIDQIFSATSVGTQVTIRP